ncbi:RdgB/HAM1 family non-canonical purine NTP pyrophosphatase [Paracoccaceae bacterium GXU_MW_L88]
MSRKFEETKLVIATHNSGKLEEFRALFSPRGVEVVSAGELGLPEPDETETTFLGNARIKARAAMEATGLPALADDSGLCVDGLNGAPGVYTADWAETPEGRDFPMAMEKVNAALEEAEIPAPWTAHFNCTLVMIWPDGEEVRAVGEVNGTLAWPYRGQTGHGFDPMFQPDGETRTFAEMAPEEKNRISHRARAIHKLMEQIFG